MDPPAQVSFSWGVAPVLALRAANGWAGGPDDDLPGTRDALVHPPTIPGRFGIRLGRRDLVAPLRRREAAVECGEKGELRALFGGGRKLHVKIVTKTFVLVINCTLFRCRSRVERVFSEKKENNKAQDCSRSRGWEQNNRRHS